ncbi:DNA methyltransferase [Streptococcus pneumoniae]|uniref:DNA methyltransferase n=1 Tax=Streptococcus pneumoniae TaxID=1313 RepID=UPI0022E63D32|nr:DNA methyltransferase [Streptococcus pneumoniae]MDA2877232.1 DNA methyltransferase [Streptococcus pneumoniae]
MEIDKIIKKDVLEFMETIPDNKIDLIVTDPPYLINYKTNWRKEKHKFSNVIKNDNNPELIKEYIKECYRILKDDTAIYIFCSFDKVDFFKKEIEKYFSVKNIIIWRKNNHTAGDKAIPKNDVFFTSLTRVKSNIKTLQEVKKFFEFVNENRKNLFEMAGFKGALE